jgi:hypothetical protein
MSNLPKLPSPVERPELTDQPADALVRLGGGKSDTNAASGEQDELDNGARFD